MTVTRFPMAELLAGAIKYHREHPDSALNRAYANVPDNLFEGPTMTDNVNHPRHYGGADNPYETIKVIEAWGLGFNLGNAVKYISRAGLKGDVLEDLKKARWYLDRQINNLTPRTERDANDTAS